MSYEDFLDNWSNSILPNKSDLEREGQSLINYLAEIWLEEYKRISSFHFYDETNIDCFYNSKLVPNTLQHLSKNWYKYPN